MLNSPIWTLILLLRHTRSASFRLHTASSAWSFPQALPLGWILSRAAFRQRSLCIVQVLWAPDLESLHHCPRSAWVKKLTCHSSASWHVVHLHPAWSIILRSLVSQRAINILSNIKLYYLLYMRCGGEEYHKPARVRAFIIQDIMRQAEQVDCMMLSNNNGWEFTAGVENLYWFCQCLLYGTMDAFICQSITIKLTGFNLAPVKIT